MYWWNDSTRYGNAARSYKALILPLVLPLVLLLVVEVVVLGEDGTYTVQRGLLLVVRIVGIVLGTKDDSTVVIFVSTMRFLLLLGLLLQ